MKIPANLWLNRHGTWYLRAVVPLHLRKHFPDHKRVALNGLMEQLEVGKGKSTKIGWIKDIEISHPLGGSVKIKEIDQGDPDKEKETIAVIVNVAVSTSPSITQEKPDGQPLSKVIEDYCAERKQSGSWKQKTEYENRAVYDLLIRIFGDLPVTQRLWTKSP